MKCRLFVLLVVFAIAAGCAAPEKKPPEIVFYPPEPDPPRVQFLTSFTGAFDVEEARSGFDKFVIGKETKFRLDKPYGVAMYDGKIYVCDTNHTVVVFDLKKKKFGPMAGVQGLGKLVQPINISIDAEGNKYVSDPIRNQVVLYDVNDAYVKSYSYGVTGQWKPVDAVPFENRLYVADSMNSAIRVFDIKSGAFQKTIGATGKPEELLGRPIALTFDKDGNLYVTDGLYFKIVKYDRDGHFLATFGKAGTNLGHFQRPKGLAVDREGRIFVADAAYSVIQIFSKETYLLSVFGGPGIGAGDLLLPAKVTIDYNNLKYFEKYIAPNFEAEYLLLVSSQFADHMINVYAFGKEKGRKYLTDEEAIAEMKQKIEAAAKKEIPEGEKKEVEKKTEEQPLEAPQ